MICQNPPFGKADIDNDSMFSHFVNKKSSGKFWRTHENSLTKKNQSISETFKDFFHRICEYEPAKRLKIEDMKKQQWYNETTASLEEAKNEMKVRHGFM